MPRWRGEGGVRKPSQSVSMRFSNSKKKFAAVGYRIDLLSVKLVSTFNKPSRTACVVALTIGLGRLIALILVQCMAPVQGM